MKLKDLLETKEVIQRLIDHEWTAKIGYRIQKFIDKANLELKDFEQARIKLYEKLGTEQPVIDENGAKVLDKQGQEQKQFVVPNESIAELQKELSDLLEEEVDIVFKSLTFDDLGDFTMKSIEVTTLVNCGLLGEPEDEDC